MIKTAILQVGHPWSLESLVIMLRSIGIECLLPSEDLLDRIRESGCDSIYSPGRIAEAWGGSLTISPPLKRAEESDMRRKDVLYVDTKAHRNGDKIVAKWPNLKGKILYYRINGGKPDTWKGDEINPICGGVSCPILSPNLWYKRDMVDVGVPLASKNRSYSCYPPFLKLGSFGRARAKTYSKPICLVHNYSGWGYVDVGEVLRREVDLFIGGGGCPDGIAIYNNLPFILSNTIAMIHLKSVDAPGYALYEAMAAKCPIILPRRFIERTLTHELFVDGETCLTFDKLTDSAVPEEVLQALHQPIDTAKSVEEIKGHLEKLKDPVVNERIGTDARERLLGLMWSEKKTEDVSSLRDFMSRVFAL